MIIIETYGNAGVGRICIPQPFSVYVVTLYYYGFVKHISCVREQIYFILMQIQDLDLHCKFYTELGPEVYA